MTAPRLRVDDVCLDGEDSASTEALRAAQTLAVEATARVYGVMVGEGEGARTVLVLPGHGPSLAAAITAFLAAYGAELDVAEETIRPAMQRRR